MRVHKIIFVALTALSILSCIKNKDEGTNQATIRKSLCGDTLISNWNYGRLGLGYYKIGMPDKYSLEPGFTFWGQHTGGLGRTLEIIGCDTSVWIQWSNNALGRIAVGRTWSGTIETGLRINSSRDQFFQLYPNAKQYTPPSFVKYELWQYGNLRVGILNNKIFAMETLSNLAAMFYTNEPIGIFQ